MLSGIGVEVDPNRSIGPRYRNVDVIGETVARFGELVYVYDRVSGGACIVHSHIMCCDMNVMRAVSQVVLQKLLLRNV